MDKKDKNILIVDDEILSAMNLKISLNSSGYNKVEIANIDESLKNVFDEKHYDLALMDINLNLEFDGIDLIKDSCFKGEVIFISGYNKRLFEVKLSNVNYIGFFEKPLNLNDLLNVI